MGRRSGAFGAFAAAATTLPTKGGAFSRLADEAPNEAPKAAVRPRTAPKSPAPELSLDEVRRLLEELRTVSNSAKFQKDLAELRRMDWGAFKKREAVAKLLSIFWKATLRKHGFSIDAAGFPNLLQVVKEHGHQPGIRLVSHEVERQLRMVPGALFRLTASANGEAKSWKEEEIETSRKLVEQPTPAPNAAKASFPRQIRGRPMFLGEAKEMLKAFKEALLTPAVVRTMQNIEMRGGIHMEQHRRVLITQEWNPIMKRFDFPASEDGYNAMKAGIREFAENDYVRSCCHEVERLCGAPAGAYFGVPTAEELAARKKAEAEAARRAEEKRKEEEAKRQAEEARKEEQRRKADEARRQAEAAQRAEEAHKKEEEARRKAEEEAKHRAAEESRRRAEEETRQKEEESKMAEEEARQKSEEEARQKAEEEARQKVAEGAPSQAESKAEEHRQAEALEHEDWIDSSQQAESAKAQKDAESQVDEPERLLDGAGQQAALLGASREADQQAGAQSSPAGTVESPAADAPAHQDMLENEEADTTPGVDDAERQPECQDERIEKLDEPRPDSHCLTGEVVSQKPAPPVRAELATESVYEHAVKVDNEDDTARCREIDWLPDDLQCFDVAHQVALREEPSRASRIVGVASKGAQLLGAVEEIEGRSWLHVSPQSCRALGALEDVAWALMSGREFGLGEFLEPAAQRQPQALGYAGRYEVAHNRVAVRASPSLKGKIVGVVVQGRMLMGTPHRVGGFAWLRFEESSRKKVADIGEEAWALIDGEPLGLGQLLRPLDNDGRKALESFHATQAPEESEAQAEAEASKELAQSGSDKVAGGPEKDGKEHAKKEAPQEAKQEAKPVAKQEPATTAISDPAKVESRRKAAQQARDVLSGPLEYKVLAQDHAAPVRREPLVQSPEVGKLERGRVVLGYPGGGWLQLDAAADIDSKLHGCWVFIGTRLVAQWAELNVTGEFEGALELSWPGLRKEKRVAYNVEWRTPEGAPNPKKGHKISASNKVLVGGLPQGCELNFRVGARVAADGDQDDQDVRLWGSWTPLLTGQFS